MYEVGDMILYNDIGVCRIADIERRDFSGLEKGRLYYLLDPLYQNCRVAAPVDTTKVFMRPVISRDEVEKLIDQIPEIKGESYYSRSPRELAEHYEYSMNTHDCTELIRLTKSIYMKKRDMESRKKKFGAVDKKYMKRAEDMLFGEFAAALDIPKKDVPGYIKNKVETTEKNGVI